MKKRDKLLLGVLGLILGGYFMCTPQGAVRLNLIITGHPISAFTSSIADKEYDFHTEKNQIGYSLQNSAKDRTTDTDMINWVVTKYGIVYFAEYYGNG